MKIIGHRGARGLAPENTLASLQKGLQHHVDEIECDVRITKDKVPILHHNKRVTDPNGKQWKIAKHTYSQLLDHKKDLATLQEVLDTLHPTTPLYLEVKPGEPTAPIIAVLRAALKKGWQPTKLQIASYSFSVLKTIHAALPELPTIVNDNWSGVRARHRARALGTRRITMSQHWLWGGFIWAMHRRGYELSAFTVNNPKQAHRWEQHGLYAVITDYPDRFDHSRSS